MAEQYSPIRLQGPEIDENLFVNALTQGIAAGNAQKTALQGGLEGLIEGVQTGMSIYSGYQQIQKQGAQNEVDTDPAVIQAKKDQEVAQAKKAQADAQAAQDSVSTGTSKIKAQAAADEWKVKAADAATASRLLEVGKSGDAGAGLAELQNPDTQRYFSQNPKDGLAFLSTLEQQGAPIADLAKERDRLNALAFHTNKQSLNDDDLFKKAIEKDTADSYKNFIDVEKILNGSPFSSLKDDPTFDSGKLKLIPNQEDPKLFDLGDDKGNVIAPAIANSETQKREFEQKLLDYRNVRRQRGFEGTPPQAPVSSVPDAPQEGGLRTAVPTPAPSSAPTPSEAGSPGAIGTSAIDRARARREARITDMKARGFTDQSINQLQSQGQNLVQKRQASVPTYMVPTPTPAPEGTPTITKPIAENTATPTPTPTATSTINPKEPRLPLARNIAYQSDRFSKMLGTPVELDNFYEATDFGPLAPKIVERVNSNPVTKDLSPLYKGLIAVESAGNPNAKSGAGAAGLTQLMAGTARDLGLEVSDTVDERLNPEKNVSAGVKYLTQQFTQIQSALNQALASQGAPVEADPRMVLSAYNGGLKYVKNAIAAGHTNWDTMKEYLRRVKNPQAAAENLAYPEKVLLAASSFVQGGTPADDSFVQMLSSFGMLSPVDDNETDYS